MMKNDEVSRVAKLDAMIVLMGNACMNRNISNPAMRRYYVSGVMRLLARLLMELRALQEKDELKRTLSFFEALHPSQYENFITAVFAVCREEVVEDEDNSLAAPSNAIKLSYDISRLCRAKIAKSIDDPNIERGEENRKCTKRFMDKFKSSWCTDVKKRARHILCKKNLNCSVELPDPEDIAAFAEFLENKLSN